MGTVIDIRLHQDLPTSAQNRLRYNIEMGLWLAKRRKAQAENDYYTLNRLEQEYEMVGLP